MRELVVLSGKGGTGKTSLTASFAVLAGDAVLSDCDVAAADLHLVLTPRVHERYPFTSGREASVSAADCRGSGRCMQHCRFDAITLSGPAGAAGTRAWIDPLLCEGCGVCFRICPEGAVDFTERLCGEWMVSETRCGTLVHARLGPAAENSGKLVSTVRREARRLAETGGRDLLLTDGPPGIGCPVIASVTGATAVLAVTEPTVSGEHDLARVLALTRHFSVPAYVCVNKWDLNPAMTERIETRARNDGARTVGRVRYDRAVTSAQMRGLAVVETGAPSAADIRGVWERIEVLEAS